MRTLFFASLLLLACKGDTVVSVAGDADPSPSVPDAAPLRCDERRDLTIGHCLDEGTGEPCLDFSSTQRSFQALSEGAVVHPVNGLQGSPMFVMAVVTEGTPQGKDENGPIVELRVTQGDDLVGAYAARPLLIDGPNAGLVNHAPQLYVVAFSADEMAGQEVEARAEVTDENGDQWCGEALFEVGALIDTPILP